MKKVELIKQLEAAKALSSQVDIDKVIVLIEQIESEAKIGITQALADEVANRIERALDHNSEDLIDLDSAELELTYDNRIELRSVDVNVYEIMEHVGAVLSEYIIEEPEEEDLQVETYNENSTEQVDGFIEAQREAE
jgi:DNA-binding transcriptional ArsR family regulator